MQQHDELAALMRKHTEQRQAMAAVPPTPTLSTRAATSKREAQLTAKYEFLLRSLETLPPGREREGIRILLDWERVMNNLHE